MAFAKGRAFVILNRMAESGNSEAKKILGNLNSMSQEDLDSKLSTLFGKGGASKEGDTAPKETKGGKAPEGKETAPKGKKEPKEGKVVANKDFDPNKEGVQSIFGTEEENAKSKDKQVFNTMEEVAKPKEMKSAKEGIKPIEGDTSKKAPKSIEMLKEWADNKWEGQNDAGEIDAMYDEWKKTGTHPDNKTLGSQVSFNDYIKLEAEKFKNDPFNKAFGKRLEEMANEYDKLSGANAPKNTAMDNFKKGMEDRKQEREGVAPSKMTDAPNDETRLKQLNDDMGLSFENKFNVQKSKDGKGYDITKDGQVVKTVFSLDNVKSLMDRDLDRIYGGKEQGVAPTQKTDAFGTSKEMGGGIGGGQKDLLGKKADLANPNRPDIQAEMEQEMEDQLSGTGTDFEDAEGLAQAFDVVKERYKNDPQRLAVVNKLEGKEKFRAAAKEYLEKNSGTSPLWAKAGMTGNQKQLDAKATYDAMFDFISDASTIEEAFAEARLYRDGENDKEFLDYLEQRVLGKDNKGSASNPMTSATEGIKPVEAPKSNDPLKQGKNGFVAFYKGKTYEVFGDSKYEAQQKLAKALGVKKAYDIALELAEQDGKQVKTTPDF
jgi:hypothetical protein